MTSGEYAVASIDHVVALEQRVEDTEQEFRNLAAVVKKIHDVSRSNESKIDRVLAIVKRIEARIEDAR